MADKGRGSVPSDGERLATLEERAHGFEDDLTALSLEVGRHRDRLHKLEGIAGAFVDMQRENRRQEERQYRRLGNIVGLGGLAMTFGLLILGALQIYFHLG